MKSYVASTKAGPVIILAQLPYEPTRIEHSAGRRQLAMVQTSPKLGQPAISYRVPATFECPKLLTNHTYSIAPTRGW